MIGALFHEGMVYMSVCAHSDVFVLVITITTTAAAVVLFILFSVEHTLV